jgi:DNA repair protein RecN (Recombination protein N)
MITFLKVRNLAIVEEFAIEPGPGLNVLTGETGAGKSLLIDSLDFISGARGTTESVRSGADRMNAEAVFHVPAELRGELERAGIDVETSGEELEVIVRRELSSSGRGRVLVNGSPISVRELVELTDPLLDIHGQTNAHGRIAGRSVRELLDQYADSAEALAKTGATYAEWKEAARQLAELQAVQNDRALRLDLLKYQIDEITAARLEVGEEEALRSERAILSHSVETVAAASGAFQLLDEDEFSALDRVNRALQLLHPLARTIEELGGIERDLDDVRFRLQDAARTLASLAGNVRHDPARLDEVEERLALIERLKKKYGGSVDEVLVHLQKISVEYETLNEYEASLSGLEARAARLLSSYQSAAAALSNGRKAAAAILEKEVERELQDLAMERTTVRFAVSTADDSGSLLMVDGHPVAFGPHGYDRVELMIAPNRGDELRPMQKIASGGELSRIQLAVAAAIFKNSSRRATATLVFDEVDAGVGGRVAEAIGRKLDELAGSNQVICVTHLPQIASMGSTHFRVWKEDAQGRTRARIEKLATREQRIEEIARMLAGDRVTSTARLHAEELLTQAATPVRKRATAGRVSKSG